MLAPLQARHAGREVTPRDLDRFVRRPDDRDESAQFDNPKGNAVTPSPGPGLGRNFFTLRVNPVSRLELDANYNYCRMRLPIGVPGPTWVSRSLS